MTSRQQCESSLAFFDSPNVDRWEELLPRTGTEFESVMALLKGRGLCVEAGKIQANEVAARIEGVIVDDWSVCQFKPGRSSNGSSERQPTNTSSTMLPENFSNVTKMAPSTRPEPILTAITGGDHAQMTGWLESQTGMVQRNFAESLEKADI